MEIRLTSGEVVDIEPGDFVNCVKWFGGVWAEVKSVYEGSGRCGASITFYWHRRNPPANWNRDWDSEAEFYNSATGDMKFYQWRKVSKSAPPPEATIIHAATYYTDKFMPLKNKPW